MACGWPREDAFGPDCLRNFFAIRSWHCDVLRLLLAAGRQMDILGGGKTCDEAFIRDALHIKYVLYLHFSKPYIQFARRRLRVRYWLRTFWEKIVSSLLRRGQIKHRYCLSCLLLACGGVGCHRTGQ